MPRRKTDYVNALTNAVYDDASEIKLTTHRTKRLLRQLVREAVRDSWHRAQDQSIEDLAAYMAKELIP